MVLGPRDLPHLASVAEAAARGAAALSEESEADILLAAEAVADLTDTTVRQRLASLVEGAAPAAIRARTLMLLEERGMRSLEIIREEGRQEGRAEGRQEGRAEGENRGEVRGEARTLLKQLRLRGFSVDEATAERILTTTDVALLDRWVERVLSARTLAEVLETDGVSCVRLLRRA